MTDVDDDEDLEIEVDDEEDEEALDDDSDDGWLEEYGEWFFDGEDDL